MIMTKPNALSLLFSFFVFSASHAQALNESPGSTKDQAPEQRTEQSLNNEQVLHLTPALPEECGTWPVKTLTLLLNLTREEQLYA